MLGVGRYLLGVADLALIVGFAWLGATAVQRRLAAELDGVAAQLSTAILGLTGLLWVAELLGSFGWFQAIPYLAVVVSLGAGLRLGLGGPWGGPSGAAASRFSHRPLSESESLRGEKPSKTEGPPRLPPPATLVALKPNGDIALGRVMASVLRNPLQIPALIRTGRESEAAFSALLRCVEMLGPGLGCPYLG